MKNFKDIISVLALLLAGLNAYSQERPKWTDGYFEERNNSYVEVVTGFGYDINDAKEKATKQIIERRSLTTGTDAVVSMENNNVQITSEKKLAVSARIIDEYHEHLAPGEYKVYLLVQTAKNPTLKLEPVTVSDKYPFSARVFIPGMAQIYKGSTAKGACFIAGEVAFIGGIVVSECLRQNYIQKINLTQNVKLKKQYLDSSNRCEIARNVSIAGAAALYVWNIIDGIVAKGKKNVFIGENNIKISPYTDLHSTGLAFNIRF